MPMDTLEKGKFLLLGDVIRLRMRGAGRYACWMVQIMLMHGSMLRNSFEYFRMDAST